MQLMGKGLEVPPSTAQPVGQGGLGLSVSWVPFSSCIHVGRGCRDQGLWSAAEPHGRPPIPYVEGVRGMRPSTPHSACTKTCSRMNESMN